MITRIFLGVVIGGAIGAILGYFGKCSSGSCPLTANPYRGAIYSAVMGALLVSAFSRTPQETKESCNIVHITGEADFNAQVLDASGIFLVDLFSNRCPPCRVLAPIISSLADKYAGKVTVCKVKVDENGMTSVPRVFAGGDIVNMNLDAVTALADAKVAAEGIHKMLSGR